jgi:hypothetical protein
VEGTLVAVTGPAVPIPDFPTRYFNCPVFTDANIQDPVTMKIYNGANRHFVAWMGGAGGWQFFPTNAAGRNYVRDVCREVE